MCVHAGSGDYRNEVSDTMVYKLVRGAVGHFNVTDSLPMARVRLLRGAGVYVLRLCAWMHIHRPMVPVKRFAECAQVGSGMLHRGDRRCGRCNSRGWAGSQLAAAKGPHALL